jgi:hypothetical protein
VRKKGVRALRVILGLGMLMGCASSVSGVTGDHDAGVPAQPPVASVPFTVTERHGWQQVSDIAVATDGSFSVVWHDESEDAPDSNLAAVRLRTFDAQGRARGDERLVNTTITGRQALPAIDTFGDGALVVAFESQESFSIGPGAPDVGTGAAVRVRLFDASGEPRGSDFEAIPGGSLADVAVLRDGSFVVAAVVGRARGTTAVVTRRFYRDGRPVGEALDVGVMDDVDTLPHLASEPEDGYVLVWTRQVAAAEGSAAGPLGQRYAGDGTPRGPAFALGIGAFADRVVSTADGFVVMGAGTTSVGGAPRQSVSLRFFARDGTARAAARSIAGPPGVELIGSGLAVAGSVVLAAWTHLLADGVSSARAQRFDLTGRPIGDEIQFDDGRDESRQYPVIVGLPGGRFAVTWIAEPADPDRITNESGDIRGLVLEAASR